MPHHMGSGGAGRLLAMWLLLGAAATLSSLLGERIPLNRGFGFEAYTVYKPITEHLPEYVAQQKIDSYSIQRVLPFVAAHYALRGLGLPLEGPYILGFFQVYELVALALAVWLWLRLARDHELSSSGQWLGFLGLFVNFAVMKLTFYYPVNIDTTALLLGLVTLHAYQRDSLPGLLIVCLAGLFVWPTTILMGSLLLLFPRTSGGRSDLLPPQGSTPRSLLLVTLSVVLVFAYSLYGLRVRAPQRRRQNRASPPPAEPGHGGRLSLLRPALPAGAAGPPGQGGQGSSQGPALPDPAYGARPPLDHLPPGHARARRSWAPAAHRL